VIYGYEWSQEVDAKPRDVTIMFREASGIVKSSSVGVGSEIDPDYEELRMILAERRHSQKYSKRQRKDTILFPKLQTPEQLCHFRLETMD